MNEEKKLPISVDDGKLVIAKKMEVDLNKDGEPVLELDVTIKIDIKELPDELYDLWQARNK